MQACKQASKQATSWHLTTCNHFPSEAKGRCCRLGLGRAGLGACVDSTGVLTQDGVPGFFDNTNEGIGRPLRFLQLPSGFKHASPPDRPEPWKGEGTFRLGKLLRVVAVTNTEYLAARPCLDASYETWAAISVATQTHGGGFFGFVFFFTYSSNQRSFCAPQKGSNAVM